MKKVSSTVFFCTSFFLSAAEKSGSDKLSVTKPNAGKSMEKLSFTRGKDLGDTGADKISPRRQQMQSPRRNSNGVPFSAEFLKQENLRIEKGQLLAPCDKPKLSDSKS